MYNILKCLVLCAAIISLPARSVGQQNIREASLKAVFIYNFTKYIEWDTSRNDNDFVIGVIGYSPVTRSLIEIAKNNTAKNKRMVVRIYSKPEEIGACNVLFIPGHIPYSLPSILERTGKGILTISEEAGFARQGSALNFVVINDKLKFEANLKSIYSAGLRAGSQLLKLAIIID